MPRFSIVLTTTDRPGLLAAGVRAVLALAFDDFELLVSDNFSSIPASEILTGISDERLRIIRTDSRLTAPDHWEFAFAHVRGEYVMYLGDDNALHPGILADADRALRDHDLDLLSWRVATYFHPGWDIVYGPLPDRGNVVGIDAGTTGGLYAADPGAVLRSYGDNLRLSGCFPCMLNLLFRKSLADFIRRRAGRFFWPPNPDISCSYFALGAARPGGYAFFDRIGALGGRSVDSNLATLLSRGRSTRRVYDYLAEFGGRDMVPLHEPKFLSISNALASTISQARATMPDVFSRYSFDLRTVARKTIDDMYVDGTLPWADDHDFAAAVDAFIASLPGADAKEIELYRDECRARMQDAAARGHTGPTYIRNADQARVSLLEFWRKADPQSKTLNWRLFRETGRNPIGRHWVSGGTTYVDMGLYGGKDIADASGNLPRVLASFDRPGDAFLNYHRNIGMLGERLTGEPRAPRSAAAPAAVAVAHG